MNNQEDKAINDWCKKYNIGVNQFQELTDILIHMYAKMNIAQCKHQKNLLLNELLAMLPEPKISLKPTPEFKRYTNIGFNICISEVANLIIEKRNNEASR